MGRRTPRSQFRSEFDLFAVERASMGAASSANGPGWDDGAGRASGRAARSDPQAPELSTGSGSWQSDASVRDREHLPNVTTSRILADSVGQELLSQIASDFLALVGSTVAICELSGECVAAVFESPWCEFLDKAAMGRADVADGGKAPEGGKSGCLGSCRREATRTCVEAGQPTDVECRGGMHVHAVPIWAQGEVIGAVSLAYGEVPQGPAELRRIAECCGVEIERLDEKARTYEPRPQLIVDVAKKQVASWVRLIGEIVERKRTTDALRDREEFSSSLLESSPSPLLVIEPDASIRHVNPALEALTGFSAAEVVGKKPPYPWWTEDAFREGGDRFGRALREGMDRAEETFQKKSGEPFWVEVTSVPVMRRGQVRYYLVNWVDITQRKRTEEAVRRSREQLRALTGHLQEAGERERTRLARHIHDDVGHALACLKMDVARLEKGLGNTPAAKLRERMQAMSEMLDATMESVRQTASELRPGILDDVGLAAVLEWEAKEFERRTGIKCAFNCSIGTDRLDRRQSTALYRICQQLLTNVAMHSGANAVGISLAEHAGDLLLEVSDNGRGISAESVSSSASLGIVGMRERALLMGGELSISAARGQGTTAAVRIPLGGDQAPGEAAP